QLSDHVIPRLESLDAPLLVVIGGSTGAGKSTLVNVLVGQPVTRAGAIRPTTRRPVLLHHPADEAWFTGTRILPGLARVHAGQGDDPEAPGTADTTGDVDPATSLALHAHASVPQGLALLDAPDIDSVAAGNRELARQLLRAADLWLFVTPANRYADALPWEVLRTAAARDLAGAVDGLAGSAERLAQHAATQDAERQQLKEQALEAFSGARERIDEALGDGSLLRGEVLSRWQDVVGTGEFFRGVEALVTRAR